MKEYFKLYVSGMQEGGDCVWGSLLQGYRLSLSLFFFLVAYVAADLQFFPLHWVFFYIQDKSLMGQRLEQ